MDRQSERLLLRRVYAFLKSRKLHRAAHELEKEAQLQFDWPRVGSMIDEGRWRSADEYVSAFLGDRTTPEAAAALFPVRFQRFVRALRRGDEAWARRYLARGIVPILRSHPDRGAVAAAAARCLPCWATGPPSTRTATTPSRAEPATSRSWTISSRTTDSRS
jgi:hypothetical protein